MKLRAIARKLARLEARPSGGNAVVAAAVAVSALVGWLLTR